LDAHGSYPMAIWLKVFVIPRTITVLVENAGKEKKLIHSLSSCAMSILTEEVYVLYFFLDASPLLRLKALDPIHAYKVGVRIMVISWV
jgi:hypothetical protein